MDTDEEEWVRIPGISIPILNLYRCFFSKQSPRNKSIAATRSFFIDNLLS
jgi:hypothetical protein